MRKEQIFNQLSWEQNSWHDGEQCMFDDVRIISKLLNIWDVPC